MGRRGGRQAWFGWALSLLVRRLVVPGMCRSESKLRVSFSAVGSGGQRCRWCQVLRAEAALGHTLRSDSIQAAFQIGVGHLLRRGSFKAVGRKRA